MQTRRPLVILGTFVAVVALAAFALLSRPAEPAADDGRLVVLTTFLPIYVFTANVVGDDARVENLLPPGAGPHEYSFTPGDVRRIAEADVIVMNGLGLEEWMANLVAESGTRARIVEASAGIETAVPPEPAFEPEGEAAHEEGDTDPHVWLDPVRAAQMVRTIAAELAAADGAHADGYRTRGEAYAARLLALDAEFREALTPLPRKDFIAFHSAFGYLAARYGLDERAVIEEFPGKEPGARYVAQVIDVIRREGVRAIFTEPQFSPTIVEAIARDTGLTVRELDTAETGAFAPDTYERVMRKNLETLVQAFSE